MVKGHEWDPMPMRPKKYDENKLKKYTMQIANTHKILMTNIHKKKILKTLK